MVGFITFIITIISGIIGIIFNRQFQNKYFESALDLGWCIVQSILVFCVLITMPNPDITGWFILWCLVTVISYMIGLSSCRQRAILVDAEIRDIKKIMAAQFLLPIGAALILVIILFLFSRERKG